MFPQIKSSSGTEDAPFFRGCGATVSKLVVWKARYKGSVNGFKIAPPSSGRGSADFLAESLMVQGVLNARR